MRAGNIQGLEAFELVGDHTMDTLVTGALYRHWGAGLVHGAEVPTITWEWGIVR